MTRHRLAAITRKRKPLFVRGQWQLRSCRLAYRAHLNLPQRWRMVKVRAHLADWYLRAVGWWR